MLSALAALAVIGSQQSGPTAAVQSTNAFGIRLLKEIDQTRFRYSSVVLSPFSADVAFAALLAGLTGPTRTELAGALSLSAKPLPSVAQSYQDMQASLRGIASEAKFTSSNSFWLSPGSKSPASYQQAIQQSFNAEIRTLQALGTVGAGQVNGWIAEQTAGEIKHVLDSIPDQSEFVLVNTALFSAKWMRRVSGRTLTFTRDGGATTNLKGLFLESELPYAENKDWQAAAIPYEGGRFVFVIAKPTGGNLAAALAGLDSAQWNDLIGSMQEKLGRVTWPEFKFESRTELLPLLAKLGAKRLQVSSADFEPIMGKLGMISDAFQQAMIDVDENGTKAAAATVIIGRAGAAPRPPNAFQGFTLIADKPFVFAIVDRETKASLFLGIYAGPND
ncbi:MAG TPA: serpin family protein [Fimbriimonadaceae bacterium]|nr:serpin family protein [Fimbriimonadaceae bacterium]